MLQTFTVELPSGWKLIENWTEMLAQRLHPTEQSIERLFRILQLFHMRQKPARFHAVEKAARRPGRPRAERRPLRKPIERIVDFDRVENPCVLLEPPGPDERRRIEISAPMLVFPTRTTNLRRMHLGANASAMPRPLPISRGNRGASRAEFARNIQGSWRPTGWKSVNGNLKLELEAQEPTTYLGND